MQIMKVDSKAYEKLVAEIAKRIMCNANNVPRFQLRSGKDCLINGASGHAHQIDVEIKTQDRTYIIECKCWSKKVPVDQMLVFLSRVIDIRNNAGGDVIPIFVTTKGYQPGAELIANKYEIDMHTVKNANEFALGIADNLTVGISGVESKAQIGELKIVNEENP